MSGVSFKHEHFAAITESRPHRLFFEVHAENYMGAGGPSHQMLSSIRRDHPISIHGVCMSIGGAEPLCASHLERLAGVVERYEPALVSEHLAWSTHAGTYFNDLLPLPYSVATLNTVCDHVDHVQQVLKRQILLENPSTYLCFASSTMSETDFLRAVAQRTGCGMLLDINNAFVSAVNQGYSATEYLSEFPIDYVGEIHLAGHAEQRDHENTLRLIDSHDRKVSDPVWDLYAKTLLRIGAVPTLIEWDSHLPDWPVLVKEARRARSVMAQTPQARTEGVAFS